MRQLLSLNNRYYVKQLTFGGELLESGKRQVHVVVSARRAYIDHTYTDSLTVPTYNGCFATLRANIFAF